VRHLLNHQGGLQDYEDLIPSNQRVPVRDADVLALVKATTRTQFTPGSQYAIVTAVTASLPKSSASPPACRMPNS